MIKIKSFESETADRLLVQSKVAKFLESLEDGQFVALLRIDTTFPDYEVWYND